MKLEIKKVAFKSILLSMGIIFSSLGFKAKEASEIRKAEKSRGFTPPALGQDSGHDVLFVQRKRYKEGQEFESLFPEWEEKNQKKIRNGAGSPFEAIARIDTQNNYTSTGFLVTPRKFVLSAHAAKKIGKGAKIQFGYSHGESIEEITVSHKDILYLEHRLGDGTVKVDAAMIQLPRKVKIKPLRILNARHHDLDEDADVLVLGYHGNNGKGERAEVLTAMNCGPRPDLTIKFFNHIDDCFAYPGASGGPILFMTEEEDDEDGPKVPFVVGITSGVKGAMIKDLNIEPAIKSDLQKKGPSIFEVPESREHISPEDLAIAATFGYAFVRMSDRRTWRREEE